MRTQAFDTLVVLGPTASGKTALGVRLAAALDGEILSADSRQVYRGLDIGSGKDLQEYVLDDRQIPYHLIDIVDLKQEFSVYDFQQAFFEVHQRVAARGKLSVVVGGTGLYLEAVLEQYAFSRAPEDPVLRAELDLLDDSALRARLFALRPEQHNRTDLDDRARLVRAIEIALSPEAANAHEPLSPLLLGTCWPRDVLRQRIGERLRARLELGLVEEVERLHAAGYSWERLELLGLEYRFVAQFLQGAIRSRNDLFQKLNSAIAQFAKRQETWFRRMERRGHVIHWIEGADVEQALRIVSRSP